MVVRVSARSAVRRRPAIALRLAVLALPLALAACGSSGDGVGQDIMSVVLPKPKAMDPALYAATPVCPEVEIREGTEFMPVFKSGKFGDPGSILFQGSIQRVARDCDMDGDRLRVRVGVAGRVLSGPSGSTGAASVPIRVAVVIGDKVVYSKLSQATVNIQAPDYSALWSVVDDGVLLTIEESKEATIYAGFDGRGDLPGGKEPARKKKTTKG